ncbi:MAG: hypothetical protein JJV98_11880 [Desulfosarcina sp.]|nr:hypothetical protein [Desulfobacterales bacterium]
MRFYEERPGRLPPHVPGLLRGSSKQRALKSLTRGKSIRYSFQESRIEVKNHAQTRQTHLDAGSLLALVVFHRVGCANRILIT